MNYIARGYVSLSEEHHRSHSPRRSFPPRARESFFPPSFFFRPSSSSPGRHLIPAARGFRWRIIFVNGHPRMLRREYCTSGSPRQVIIEYLSSILSLSSPLSPSFISSFPSRSRAQLVVKRIPFLNYHS